MSATGITREFEKEWGAYQGTAYNLAHCNGTAALLSAMFAIGLGAGDELIVPSVTYWASGHGAKLLGATPVFADVDPKTLCIDPSDIIRRITPRTRAIIGGALLRASVRHGCDHGHCQRAGGEGD